MKEDPTASQEVMKALALKEGKLVDEKGTPVTERWQDIRIIETDKGDVLVGKRGSMWCVLVEKNGRYVNSAFFGSAAVGKTNKPSIECHSIWSKEGVLYGKIGGQRGVITNDVSQIAIPRTVQISGVKKVDSVS